MLGLVGLVAGVFLALAEGGGVGTGGAPAGESAVGIMASGFDSATIVSAH